MDTMSTPTTRWTSLPSHAPSLATCEAAGVPFAVGASLAGDVPVGAAAQVTRYPGADIDIAGTPSINHGNTCITRNKDIRPGSRAWSPPV